MTPSALQYRVGFTGFAILDGAWLPEEHRGHIVQVLEHIPKCCESDYVHNSRVRCQCGAEYRISDQFLIDGRPRGFTLDITKRETIHPHPAFANGHTLLTPSDCKCDKDDCPVCEHGLAVCQICNAAEIELQQPCQQRLALKFISMVGNRLREIEQHVSSAKIRQLVDDIQTYLLTCEG